MKFSIIPSVFCLLVFVASCKKNDENPTKAEFFACEEFSEPKHNFLPLQFSPLSLNLMPFNDGCVLGEDFDNNKYVLFDRDMKYVTDLDNIEGWDIATLNDNSLLSSKSYVKNFQSYPPTQLSAYHFRGFYNCEPDYLYQSGGVWNGWKAESVTEITKQKKNGEVEFRLTLEGYLVSNFRYNSGFLEIVERDGFIYLATYDVDSALIEYVEDEYGNFQDTVNIGCRNAKVNLFKLSYSGEVIWKKTVENVIGFQPDQGAHSFGATRNYLWLFTTYEIFQFDFNGNLLRSNCNEGSFGPMYFFDGGMIGTRVFDNVEYKLLTEGFSYEEVPVNAPLRCFAVDGNVVFSRMSEKIISYNFLTNQTKVIYIDGDSGLLWGWARGCDGSFYFCNYMNAVDQNLIRIAKDGKSSYRP